MHAVKLAGREVATVVARAASKPLAAPYAHDKRSSGNTGSRIGWSKYSHHRNVQFPTYSSDGDRRFEQCHDYVLHNACTCNPANHSVVGRLRGSFGQNKNWFPQSAEGAIHTSLGQRGIPGGRSLPARVERPRNPRGNDQGLKRVLKKSLF
jgi:hypothetical protein